MGRKQRHAAGVNQEEGEEAESQAGRAHTDLEGALPIGERVVVEYRQLAQAVRERMH